MESFKVILQILDEKMVNNLTTKAYCAPRIIYSAIFKLFTEGSYEPLYVCDKNVIIFGTRKILLDSITHLMWTIGTDSQYKLQTIK